MSTDGSFDMSGVDHVPPTLSPDQALVQLQVTAGSVMTEIAAALTPFVDEGLSIATAAMTEAESIIAELATADVSKLPSEFADIQTLIQNLMKESGQSDVDSSGQSVPFPEIVSPLQSQESSSALQTLAGIAQTSIQQSGQATQTQGTSVTPTPTIAQPQLSQGQQSPVTATGSVPPTLQPLQSIQTQPTLPAPSPVTVPTAASTVPPFPKLTKEMQEQCPPCLLAYLQTLQSALQAIQATVETTNAPTSTSIQSIAAPVFQAFSAKEENKNGKPPQLQPGEIAPGVVHPDFRTEIMQEMMRPKPAAQVKSKIPELPTKPTVGSFAIPNWNSVDVCGSVDKWGIFPQNESGDQIRKWLTDLFTAEPGKGNIQRLIDVSKKIPYVGEFFADLIKETGAAPNALLVVVTKIANLIGSELGCDMGDAAIPFTMEALIGLAAKYIGDEFYEYATPFAQWRRFVCPTTLPTIADANAAYLANSISDDTWECWVRANNGLPIPARTVREAGRLRLSRDDYVSLWLRKEITKEQLHDRLRELGMTQAADRKGVEDLSIAIPGIGDIIRFLVRDVGDMRIVKSFGLDASFEQKWSEDLARLGAAQGVTDELARYYWRAHWDIPSPTQLYTMLHRLRPGRVTGIDPNAIGRALTDQEQKQRLNINDLVVTAADAKLALEQDDIAPFWVNRLMAISYRAITRTDARSAYIQSSIDRKELVESLQDFGYSQERANVLARIYDKMKVRTLLRSNECMLYIKGVISKEELTLSLKEDDVEPFIIDKVLKRAELRSKARFRDKCLTQIVKAYYKGDMSDVQLREALRKLGLTLEHVNKLIPDIQCEAAHRDKELALTQIARLYFDGLIKEPTLLLRLARIGYAANTVKLLVADIVKQKEIRDGLAQERKTKKQQAAERKAKREAEALERQRAKDEREMLRGEPPMPLGSSPLEQPPTTP